MHNLETGLVQIYTGANKGKTTAALGLAIRAVGHGFHVYILQFMKNSETGEQKALLRLQPECQIERYGTGQWIHKGNAQPEDIQAAREGLDRAREIIQSGEWDIVILDEIINALWFELLTEEEVIGLLELKPKHVEIVLTGRNASPGLIAKADLVTEMMEIKHPYVQGIPARLGIEY